MKLNFYYMDRTERFIEKAKKIHGSKYSYSKVNYRTCKEKVCIICPIHGEFWQTPYNHINEKQGCPKCGKEKAIINETLTTEKFIEKARKIHGDKYDYSKVDYKGNKVKVCIICPKHGEFWQTPANHTNIRLKQGCPKCKFEKNKNNQMVHKDEFVSRATKIHGDKYDYSEVVMNGLHKKVKIFCKKCKKFFYQEPNSHLRGKECPYCHNKYLKTDDVIKMFIEFHGDKYDYSKVKYRTMRDKVCIICPEHGEFWQTPFKHIKEKQGCPSCKESHLEEEVRVILSENNINFVYDKANEYIGKQRFDFYLPDYNIAIECQGIQHFKPSSFSNKIDGKKYYEKIKKMDKQKYNNANINNIKILYYSNLGYNIFLGEKILKNKTDLLSAINAYSQNK